MDTALPGRCARGCRLLLALLRWAVALILLGLVLEPMLWRGLLRSGSAESVWMHSLAQVPTADRLAELSAYSLQDIPVPQGPDAVMLADRLLGGQDLMQGFSAAPYALPFTEKARVSDQMLRAAGSRAPPVIYAPQFNEVDLMRPEGIGPLPYASLYLADVLLQAHATSGSERYLAAARDHILSFARYEQAHWRQLGFLWNDHAIASRAGVLARFWVAYRNHASKTSESTAELLTQVRRTVALLASPRDFNVRTNHGVMQNVALLQLLQAFPGLEKAPAHRELARARLATQIEFLYSEDGFVLEHSAHYHDVGVKLLAMAIRLLELNGEPVPPLWRQRLTATTERLAQLTRPDGTLPAYGDTELELWPAGMPVPAAAPPARFGLYPLAGYALWNFEKPLASHSVVSWSLFPGHGHKLADEPSLLTWAQGRGWLTNTGYWGYGGWGRAQAEGWRGSNAPHWVGENPQGRRTTQLLGSAQGNSGVYLNLQRTTQAGARFEREIVNLATGLWLVVDKTSTTKDQQVETLWTFMPDLALTEASAASYRLRDTAGATLAVAFKALQPLSITQHRGERESFFGWVAMGRVGLPAPGLRVLAHPGDFSASLFTLDEKAANFSFERLGDAGWQASGQGWRVARSQGRLELQSAAGNETLSVAATDAAAPEVQRALIGAKLQKALQAYPRELNLDAYRDRVSLALLALLALQEGALALLGRLVRGRVAELRLNLSVNLLILLGWLALGTWLLGYYFHPSL